MQPEMKIALSDSLNCESSSTVNLVEVETRPKVSQSAPKLQIGAVRAAHVKKAIDILAAIGIITILSLTFVKGPAPVPMLVLTAGVAVTVFLSWPTRPHEAVHRTIIDHLCIFFAPVICELILLGLFWTASTDLWSAFVPRLLLWLTLIWCTSYRHVSM